MIPFYVDKDWYENYWLSERKKPVRRPVIRTLIRAALSAIKESADAVVWIHLHQQRARDLEMLMTFGDRELWDLGLSRADIPSVVEGTYRRDGTMPSKTMAKPTSALTSSNGVQQPVGAMAATSTN